MFRVAARIDRLQRAVAVGRARARQFEQAAEPGAEIGAFETDPADAVGEAQHATRGRAVAVALDRERPVVALAQIVLGIVDRERRAVESRPHALG